MSKTETKPLTLIAFTKWQRNMGISDTTGWRWAKAGWLHPINICGKLYLTPEDQTQFYERVERGEFAREPKGAAGAAHKRHANA